MRAFVPSPLPPDPAIDFRGPLLTLIEQAYLALGRLDSLSTLLPDPALFIYAYVRKEAVLSSQIEGTQSSLSDLLLFELDDAPGAPIDDVVEVSSYVAALDHGLRRLREGFPLCNRLLREIHEVLLTSGRGSEKPEATRRLMLVDVSAGTSARPAVGSRFRPKQHWPPTPISATMPLAS